MGDFTHYTTSNLLVIILFIVQCVSQDCRTRGESCSDSTRCCGGCCIQNTCINTYQDCREMTDPCLDDYCPAGSICRLYKPTCQGCEIERRNLLYSFH